MALPAKLVPYSLLLSLSFQFYSLSTLPLFLVLLCDRVVTVLSFVSQFQLLCLLLVLFHLSLWMLYLLPTFFSYIQVLCPLQLPLIILLVFKYLVGLSISLSSSPFFVLYQFFGQSGSSCPYKSLYLPVRCPSDVRLS